MADGARFCGACGWPAAGAPVEMTGPAGEVARGEVDRGGFATSAAASDEESYSRYRPAPDVAGPPRFHPQPPGPSGYPADFAGTVPSGPRPPGQFTSPPWPDPGQVEAGSPPGVPWAGQRPGGTGRDGLDAFLGGDWTGAALGAGSAVGSMIVVTLVALLLAGAGRAGTHVVLSVTAMLVCAAFGGDLFARAGATSTSVTAAASASLGALPLTLTLVGTGVLAVLFLRRLHGGGILDALFQVVRTSFVLAGLLFVLALVSRLHSAASAGLFGIDGSVGASVASSVVGAVLFCVAALAVGWFLARPVLLPPRLQLLREATRPGLFGCAAVLLVGLAAAMIGLVYTLSTQDQRPVQLGAALLALPNVGLGGILLTLGVPLSVHGSVSGLGSGVSSVVGAGATGDSVTLLTLTERSAWWWAAPVVLAAALIAVTVALVVRQHTLRAARREALRFAGCFAVVAFVTALLLRVAANGGGGLIAGSVSGDVSVTFNPLVAAIVAGLWGLVAAVLAPQIAAASSGALVQAVRGRFGTAAQPPGQASPGGYGQRYPGPGAGPMQEPSPGYQSPYPPGPPPPAPGPERPHEPAP